MFGQNKRKKQTEGIHTFVCLFDASKCSRSSTKVPSVVSPQEVLNLDQNFVECQKTMCEE